MATVVLIHGIAQEQLSADSLEMEWLPALAGGVRKAGFSEVADRLRPDLFPRNGRMAFYGHLFLQPDQQGDDHDFTLKELADMEKLAQEWLEGAASRASEPRERQVAEAELAYVRQKVGAEEAGTGEAVRMAIKSLAKLRWFAPYGIGFAERFVFKALSQVTRYLTDETIRHGALNIVLELTGPDTKVLLGHSLGSVIAYEVAHLMKHLLPLLVTIGSPLGLATVYPKLRPQPPTYPQKALRWVNIADRDDFVAAEPDLTNLFSHGLPPDARFEAAHTVDNGAKPHDAKFYLTKAKLGRPIGETLNTL
jgi:hypothetical protein